MTPTFTPPTEDDLRLLGERWTAIASLVEEELDSELDQTLDAVDLLQQILDRELVNGEGLLAVGVALGRIMAVNIEGLDWWAVQDESGRELCLRYEETTLLVNPISMIAKRLGHNEKVDVMQLFLLTQQQVAEIADQAD
jgi:Domain of unknown function (DUF3806)